MHRLALACVTNLILTSVARSQVAHPVGEGAVDLGAAALRQPGLADASVFTAAGQYRLATAVSDLWMNGIGAVTSDNRFTGQAIVGGSRYASPVTRWRWELSANGSAFGLSNAGPAFGWQAFAREHYALPLGGAFAGVGAGQIAERGLWNRLVTAHVGGYVRPDRTGRDELSAAIAATDFGTLKDVGVKLRYGDAIAYWSHHADHVDLIAGGDARLMSFGNLTSDAAASGSAALWLNDHVAFVLAGGRALSDVTRGVPSVRYVSASIRLGARGGDARLAVLVRRARTVAEIGRVVVRVASDSMRLVSVREPAASTVEIMADFTQWQPVALTKKADGNWIIACAIAPGIHRVSLRVDAGPWTVPPNLPRVEDEFGGEAGILIVP